MAIRSGFFNAVKTTNEDGSVTYDRTYYADDFNKYLNRVVSNGVFASPSTNLQILADGSGMDVIVCKGGARINGAWLENDSDYTITIAPSDVILDRIDRIILELYYDERRIDIVYVQGELSSNPEPPTLIRGENLIQLSLAQIYVGKGVTRITQDKITDTRPLEDECGLIATMGQMESNNYFIQMQEFVDNFISTKSNEYETWEDVQKAAFEAWKETQMSNYEIWETQQQTTFDDWFETIKDEVRATSLYREYSAFYKTEEENQNIIPIPSSLNYVYNGLDVLNVYTNGIRLVEGIDYNINNTGTNIILTNPLAVFATPVEFVNKKSIDESGAEEVVTRVETLEERVNALVDTETAYTCNGMNDNVILSNKVQDFLTGVGDYSAVADNAQLRINVNGIVGISELIEEQSIFGFSVEHSSNRKVFVDFTNATIPAIDIASYDATTFAVFNLEKEVTIISPNINIYGNNLGEMTIYCCHGGNVENCKVYNTSSKDIGTLTSETNIYVMYACQNVSNSIIDINTNVFRTYCLYGVENAYFNNVKTAVGTAIYGSGIYIGNTLKGEVNITDAKANVGNYITS